MLAVQAGGDAKRVLAADRDEGVEALVAEVPQNRFDSALELVGVRASRA